MISKLPNSKANVYTQNLRNLADRSVMKVADKDENDRISDMFALMSNFAFLQTGLNKSKLSYTNVVDFTNFLDVMKSESESFTTALALDGNNILDQFFEKFVSVNSRKNINKGRFKDYLMDIDFETFKNVIPDTQPTGVKGFQGYKGGFEDKGKGTPQGDGKDKAMRQVADGFIGETSDIGKSSSTLTSHRNVNKDLAVDDENGVLGYNYERYTAKVVMLARNGSLKGKALKTETKQYIDNAFEDGVEFVVGDMPGVDSQFIDYLQEIGAKFTIYHTGTKSRIQVTRPSTQPTETEDTPFELKETDRTNVFQYQDQLGDKDFYEKLVDANQTVVFVRNNVNETYSNKKKNFGGQQELDKFAGNMTMNITTSLTKLGDNFQDLPKQAYAEVMRLWEEEIAHIQSINDGQTKFTPIAFPETGFGDPALMPQELFVYLSTRLFDAFGYVNPGSAMYNEMQKRTEIAEGLTDQEILDQLGLEEDPFKCE